MNKKVERMRVVVLRQEGKSYREIIKTTGHKYEFIKKWVDRYGKTGNVDDEQRPGRPLKLNQKQTTMIKRGLKRKRCCSTRAVVKLIKREEGVNICPKTVWTYGNRMELWK